MAAAGLASDVKKDRNSPSAQGEVAPEADNVNGNSSNTITNTNNTDNSKESAVGAAAAVVDKQDAATDAELKHKELLAASVKRAHEDAVLEEAAAIQVQAAQVDAASKLKPWTDSTRMRTHWDYLLQEMAWLAADFAQERIWKVAAASHCARYATTGFTARSMRQRQQFEQSKIASGLAAAVLHLWQAVASAAAELSEACMTDTGFGKEIVHTEQQKPAARKQANKADTCNSSVNVAELKRKSPGIVEYMERFLKDQAEPDAGRQQSDLAEGPATPQRVWEELPIEHMWDEASLPTEPLWYCAPDAGDAYRTAVEAAEDARREEHLRQMKDYSDALAAAEAAADAAAAEVERQAAAAASSYWQSAARAGQADARRIATSTTSASAVKSEAAPSTGTSADEAENGTRSPMLAGVGTKKKRKQRSAGAPRLPGEANIVDEAPPRLKIEDAVQQHAFPFPSPAVQGKRSQTASVLRDAAAVHAAPIPTKRMRTALHRSTPTGAAPIAASTPSQTPTAAYARTPTSVRPSVATHEGVDFNDAHPTTSSSAYAEGDEADAKQQRRDNKKKKKAPTPTAETAAVVPTANLSAFPGKRVATKHVQLRAPSQPQSVDALELQRDMKPPLHDVKLEKAPNAAFPGRKAAEDAHRAAVQAAELAADKRNIIAGKRAQQRDRNNKQRAKEKVASALPVVGGPTPWTAAEDQVLLAIVSEFTNNWALVSDVHNAGTGLKGVFRTPQQCQQRFLQLASGDKDQTEESAVATLQITKNQARAVLHSATPLDDDQLRGHIDKINHVMAKHKARKLQMDRHDANDRRSTIHPSHAHAAGLAGNTGTTVLSPIDLSEQDLAGPDALGGGAGGAGTIGTMPLPGSMAGGAGGVGSGNLADILPPDPRALGVTAPGSLSPAAAAALYGKGVPNPAMFGDPQLAQAAQQQAQLRALRNAQVAQQQQQQVAALKARQQAQIGRLAGAGSIPNMDSAMAVALSLNNGKAGIGGDPAGLVNPNNPLSGTMAGMLPRAGSLMPGTTGAASQVQQRQQLLAQLQSANQGTALQNQTSAQQLQQHVAGAGVRPPSAPQQSRPLSRQQRMPAKQLQVPQTAGGPPAVQYQGVMGFGASGQKSASLPYMQQRPGSAGSIGAGVGVHQMGRVPTPQNLPAPAGRPTTPLQAASMQTLAAMTMPSAMPPLPPSPTQPGNAGNMPSMLSMPLQYTLQQRQAAAANAAAQLTQKQQPHMAQKVPPTTLVSNHMPPVSPQPTAPKSPSLLARSPAQQSWAQLPPTGATMPVRVSTPSLQSQIPVATIATVPIPTTAASEALVTGPAGSISAGIAATPQQADKDGTGGGS